MEGEEEGSQRRKRRLGMTVSRDGELEEEDGSKTRQKQEMTVPWDGELDVEEEGEEGSSWRKPRQGTMDQE